MKGLLIDPVARTVSEVDLTPGITTILGCEHFAGAYLPNGDVIFVDDEGLLKENTFFLAEGYPQPLAGRGLVVGTTPDGNTAEPQSTIESLDVDFGQPMKVGGMIMFIGEKNVREITC